MSSSRSTRSAHSGGVFSFFITDDRPGLLVFEVPAEGAALFADEAGGHRWQRIPPTEKRGRVQSSTVTVAVMAEPTDSELHIDPCDLHVIATRGTGPGGQARNTTDSCIQMTYKPTGLQVRCDTERSQHQNRQSALALLRARLWDQMQAKASGERQALRRGQIGSGMRGDKRRTVQVKNNQVTDHVSGRTWRLKDYLRGEW